MEIGEGFLVSDDQILFQLKNRGVENHYVPFFFVWLPAYIRKYTQTNKRSVRLVSYTFVKIYFTLNYCSLCKLQPSNSKLISIVRTGHKNTKYVSLLDTLGHKITHQITID